MKFNTNFSIVAATAVLQMDPSPFNEKLDAVDMSKISIFL